METKDQNHRKRTREYFEQMKVIKLNLRIQRDDGKEKKRKENLGQDIWNNFIDVLFNGKFDFWTQNQSANKTIVW